MPAIGTVAPLRLPSGNPTHTEPIDYPVSPPAPRGLVEPTCDTAQQRQSDERFLDPWAQPAGVRTIARASVRQPSGIRQIEAAAAEDALPKRIPTVHPVKRCL
jgi:hypothetical protein